MPSCHSSRCLIVKDLLLLSCSVFLTSMANCGLMNLQTSLNDVGELGNKTLTVNYLFAFGSTLFLTSIVIRKLGLKWTLIVSIGAQVPYYAANFWPVWYTMYSGAAIAGIFSGPLWSAANSYLVAIGRQYASYADETHANNDETELAISRFFGIFYAFFRFAAVAGSVLASLILKRQENTVLPSQENIRNHCGPHYCYEGSHLSLNQNVSEMMTLTHYRPTIAQIHVLFSIYLACATVAIPLVALVRSVVIDNESPATGWKSDLLGTFTSARRRKQILLMPLSLFGGVIYAFSTGDYVLGYVTCTSGIDIIGYVMSSFGAAATLGSMLFGPLLKYMGRIMIFTFGFLCNFGILTAMLMWTPAQEMQGTLHVFAAFLGMTSTIWVSQLAAFIGFLYALDSPEKAFSVFLLYQMLGNGVWHGVSYYLCLDLQIDVMIALLSLGFVGYSLTEYLMRRKLKEANSADEGQQKPGDGVKETNLDDIVYITKL